MNAKNTATDSTNTKPAAAAAPKETKMATAADAKLSYADLLKKLEDVKKQEAELAALIAGKASEELKTLVNGWKLKAEQAGFTVQQVVDELSHYLPRGAAKKSSTPKAEGEKKEPKFLPLAGNDKLDQDKTHARPEIGVTYKLPNGKPWTKDKAVGRAPFEVVEALQAGATWAEMKVKA